MSVFAVPLRTLATVLSIAALAISAPARAGSLLLTFGERSVTVNGITPGGDVVLFDVAKEPEDSVVIAATTLQAAPRTMAISISGSTIVVSGAAPGSEVLVFAAYQENIGYMPALGTYQKFITDDDHDGVVTADFGKPVPHRSVWIAVDTRNGDYAVAAPAGYRLQLHDLPVNAVTKSKTGDDALSLSLGSAEILVLRPSGGVWRGVVDRGGTSDEHDVDDKKLLVSASHLKALRRKENGPQTLLPSDRIIAINPFTLETLINGTGK